MGENLGYEIDQVVDLDGDHIRIAALSLRREASAVGGEPFELPRRFS